MIDLGSIAGLYEHQHELHAHCPRCDAWRVLPLGEWVSQGKGSLRHRRFTGTASTASIEPTREISHAWLPLR
jgi:hypothetical protein